MEHYLHWRIQGRELAGTPPLFMQLLGKIGQNNRLAPPPSRLAHIPLENPGSATDVWPILHVNTRVSKTNFTTLAALKIFSIE